MIAHHPYPGDITDAEWEFVLPNLRPLLEDAGQRVHNLRDILDALRWVVRSGSPWRHLPKDFPPWPMVYQQTRRWIDAGSFEAIVHDLRAVPRFAEGREPEPTAAVLESRTIQSTPESGPHAGYDGHKRKKGSKAHLAVLTPGHLLPLLVTPANQGDRDQLGRRCEAITQATGGSVELAYVDQGQTGDDAFDEATGRGIILDVAKLPEAKPGFVQLPRRWVVERSFGLAARFRRMARDQERLSTTLAGLHYVTYSPLILHKAAPQFAWSS